MEMCLTSTNFTLKKKKFTAVHFVKGLSFSFFVVFFFPVCVFFFVVVVCLFACLLVFYVQVSLKFNVGDYRASTSLGFLEGE